MQIKKIGLAHHMPSCLFLARKQCDDDLQGDQKQVPLVVLIIQILGHKFSICHKHFRECIYWHKLYQPFTRHSFPDLPHGIGGNHYEWYGQDRVNCILLAPRRFPLPADCALRIVGE